jgi:hypothetical protein
MFLINLQYDIDEVNIQQKQNLLSYFLYRFQQAEIRRFQGVIHIFKFMLLRFDYGRFYTSIKFI